MRYRRTGIAGATYFFTVNLAERHRALLTDHIATLRTKMRDVKQRHPFHIDAMAILPDHLHCAITLPARDAHYPMRWALIKAGFSRGIPKTEHRSSNRSDKGERCNLLGFASLTPTYMGSVRRGHETTGIGR